MNRRSFLATIATLVTVPAAVFGLRHEHARSQFEDNALPIQRLAGRKPRIRLDIPWRDAKPSPEEMAEIQRMLVDGCREFSEMSREEFARMWSR